MKGNAMRAVSVAALVSALLAVGPAEAWEAGSLDDGNGTWFNAHEPEATGKPFELAATCSEEFAGQADIAVYADAEWPAATALGFDIPMEFKLGGETMTVSGDFGEYDMRRMVVAAVAGDPTVWTLFDRIAAAEGEIVVTVAGETLRFGTDGVAGVMGGFIERCR